MNTPWSDSPALIAGLLFPVFAACAGGDSPDEGPEPRGADSVVTVPAGMDSLPPIDWSEADRGTGILFLSEWTPAPSTDTIHVWRSTVLDTIVALFIRNVPSSSGYGFRVEQAPGGSAVAGNLLEYAYEDVGLPIDSIDAAAGLARVIFGLDSAGAPLHGWARLTPNVGHMLWKEHLASRSLFFIDGVPMEFHASPGGPLQEVDIPPDDYEMTPDSAAGDWLRVTVRTPHGCSGEAAAKETVTWIRYLDPETRRPRVWYHTRGC